MPAAYCGIVGLKPTYGLVSIRGIIPRTYSLDHCGPMTKTAEDCAILLSGMVGYDKYDVASVDHPKQDYLAALKQPVNNFRLGLSNPARRTNNEKWFRRHGFGPHLPGKPRS